MKEIKQKLKGVDESKPAVAGPSIGSGPVDIPAISSINSEFAQHHAVVDDLRFIVVPVTDIERRAITRYAEACGETVADLMRKSVIRDATLADCTSSVESSHYQYHFKLPQSLTKRQERKFIESRCNQIRKILGWAPVRI